MLFHEQYSSKLTKILSFLPPLRLNIELSNTLHQNILTQFWEEEPKNDNIRHSPSLKSHVFERLALQLYLSTVVDPCSR